MLLHVFMLRAYSCFPVFKPTVFLDVQNSITSALSVKQDISGAKLSYLLLILTPREAHLYISSGDKGGEAAYQVPYSHLLPRKGLWRQVPQVRQHTQCMWALQRAHGTQGMPQGKGHIP